MDEVVESAKRLFDWSGVVGGMGLVQVDVVGLQATQAVFARFHDVLAAEALVIETGTHPPPALRGKHNVLAGTTRREPPAHDGFGLAVDVESSAKRIDIRCVEEGDTVFNGGVHDGEGCRLVCLVAEGHGAEAYLGNTQASPAQLLDLHLSGFLIRARQSDTNREVERVNARPPSVRRRNIAPPHRP